MNIVSVLSGRNKKCKIKVSSFISHFTHSVLDCLILGKKSQPEESWDEEEEEEEGEGGKGKPSKPDKGKPGKPSGGKPGKKVACGLGCFKDSPNRLLKKRLRNDNQNTPKRCARFCLRKGYKVSGVQYTRECFCGRRLPSRAKKISSGNCNHKCPGNKSKKCGGSWAMNIVRVLSGRNKKCMISDIECIMICRYKFLFFCRQKEPASRIMG